MHKLLFLALLFISNLAIGQVPPPYGNLSQEDVISKRVTSTTISVIPNTTPTNIDSGAVVNTIKYSIDGKVLKREKNTYQNNRKYTEIESNMYDGDKLMYTTSGLNTGKKQFTQYTYNNKGLLVKETHTNGGKTELTITYEYKDGKLEVLNSVFDLNPKANNYKNRTEHYNYHLLSGLVKQKTITWGNGNTKEEYFWYWDNAKIREHIIVDARGSEKYIYEYTDDNKILKETKIRNGQSRNPDYYTEYYYYDNGQLFEIQKTNRLQQEPYKIQFTYYPNGLLKEERYIDFNTGKLAFTYFYKYTYLQIEKK